MAIRTSDVINAKRKQQILAGSTYSGRSGGGFLTFFGLGFGLGLPLPEPGGGIDTISMLGCSRPICS